MFLGVCVGRICRQETKGWVDSLQMLILSRCLLGFCAGRKGGVCCIFTHQPFGCNLFWLKERLIFQSITWTSSYWQYTKTKDRVAFAQASEKQKLTMSSQHINYCEEKWSDTQADSSVQPERAEKMLPQVFSLPEFLAQCSCVWNLSLGRFSLA